MTGEQALLSYDMLSEKTIILIWFIVLHARTECENWNSTAQEFKMKVVVEVLLE